MSVFICVSGFAIIKMALDNSLKASFEATWVCHVASVNIKYVC